jgi:hypothetical protein
MIAWADSSFQAQLVVELDHAPRNLAVAGTRGETFGLIPVILVT